MRARIFTCCLAFFALALATQAQDRRSAPSLDRLLPQIQRSVPGTFYDAQGPFMSPDGQATYRIKWGTPDGRIIWLSVDARSGHILSGVPGGAAPRRDDPRGNNWGNRNNFAPNPGGNNGWNSTRGSGGWGNPPNGGGWGGNPNGGGNSNNNGNNNGNNDGNGRSGWGNGNSGDHGGDRGGNRGGNQGGQGGWGSRGGQGGGQGGGRHHNGG